MFSVLLTVQIGFSFYPFLGKLCDIKQSVSPETKRGKLLNFKFRVVVIVANQREHKVYNFFLLIIILM